MTRTLIILSCSILLLGCDRSASETATARKQPAPEATGGSVMQIGYLEMVTPEVASVCETYAKAYGVAFSEPVPALAEGAEIAVPPMQQLLGQGTFAIYVQGGVDHGIWQHE